MIPDPFEEEIQRRQWEQFYKEHPDADPIKIICTTIVLTYISGFVMLGALLLACGLAYVLGAV